MTEPVSPARLAEITEHASIASTYAEYQQVASCYVPELLAEIKRLNAIAADLRPEFAAAHDGCIHDDVTSGYAHTLAARDGWRLMRREVTDWHDTDTTGA